MLTSFVVFVKYAMENLLERIINPLSKPIVKKVPPVKDPQQLLIQKCTTETQTI